MQWDGSERRKYIRFPVKFSVQHRQQTTRPWFYSYSDNISKEGILFYSTFKYKKQSIIQIFINYPQLPKLKNPLQAQVIWALDIQRELSKIHLIGVEFLSVTPVQQHFITKLIHEALLLQKKKKHQNLPKLQ